MFLIQEIVICILLQCALLALGPDLSGSFITVFLCAVRIVKLLSISFLPTHLLTDHFNKILKIPTKTLLPTEDACLVVIQATCSVALYHDMAFLEKVWGNAFVACRLRLTCPADAACSKL